MKQKVDPYVKAMIIQAKNQAAKEAREEVFKLLLGLPVMALRDEFEFGKKRNTRFIDNLLKKYEAYSDGTITLEDVEEILKEETGIEIEGFRS